MNLHQILLEKARAQELAHFYLVEATGAEQGQQEALQSFVHKLIRDYYREVEGHKQSLTHLMDHPDVFVLGNLTDTEDPEDAFFTVAQSEALARFFEFKAVQSRRKFAVITEAHRINAVVANKWLKLLEEPQGDSTIFILNPRRQKLLDTIHSRAIHLRLQVKGEVSTGEEWLKFLESAKEQGLASFLEAHVRGTPGLEFYVNELIQWESQKTDGPQSKTALKTWLETYQEMELFHQPAATRWTLFYSFLHQHVFPRLSR